MTITFFKNIFFKTLKHLHLNGKNNDQIVIFKFNIMLKAKLKDIDFVDVFQMLNF